MVEVSLEAPEEDVSKVERPQEYTGPDDMELVELPEELQGIDPIQNQDEFVNILVNKWNSIVTLMENQTVLFSKMVLKSLEGHDDETITDVIQKIKKHPDLKLTISKDRIWQGVRLIKNRPDLVSAPRIAQEDDEIYRKKDGTKNYEFYFELYKYNIPDGMRGYFETLGKSRGWSVRELRDNINDYREDKFTPQEKKRNDKREKIKNIVKWLRGMHPDGVDMIYTYVSNTYPQYAYESDTEGEQNKEKTD